MTLRFAYDVPVVVALPMLTVPVSQMIDAGQLPPLAVVPMLSVEGAVGADITPPESNPPELTFTWAPLSMITRSRGPPIWSSCR